MIGWSSSSESLLSSVDDDGDGDGDNDNRKGDARSSARGSGEDGNPNNTRASLLFPSPAIVAYEVV